MNYAGIFLQIVGLMVCSSALIIGIQTHDPSTELTLMVAGALFFYVGYTMRQGKE